MSTPPYPEDDDRPETSIPDAAGDTSNTQDVDEVEQAADESDRSNEHDSDSSSVAACTSGEVHFSLASSLDDFYDFCSPDTEDQLTVAFSPAPAPPPRPPR